MTFDRQILDYPEQFIVKLNALEREVENTKRELERLKREVQNGQ